MLISFGFSNYGPFKDKQTINFDAIKNIKGHEQSLISNQYVNNKFLPVICFYGPNGGGKTAVISAWVSFHNILFNYNNFFPLEKLNLFNENKPLSYEITFVKKDIFYKYSISLKSNREIASETFSYYKNKLSNKEIVIFDKDKDILNIEELDVKNISKMNVIIPSVPIFSFLSSFIKNKHLENFINLMKKTFVADFASMVFNNFSFWNKTIREYMTTNKNRLLKYFSDLNFNILDYEFKKNNPIMENYEFTSLFLKKENSNFDKIWLNIALESKGTQKIISFISQIDKILEEGGYLFVDELDASLHTSLLKYIIRLFTNKKTNKNGAVLFFNSHDMLTLDKSVFRKDEIYFSSLNESHKGKIWRLSDFNVRDNNSWHKMYNEGKFGADPYIKYSMERF